MTKAETKHNACFPAGTRITTDKGLKRIEDIQVGDMVLSKHESGIGKQEFKPVKKTIVHHNKPIFELTYAIVKNSTKAYGLSDTSILNLSRKGKVFGVKATPNHPFWVKGQGWTNLEDLKKGQLLEMKEEGYQAYVILSCPEYQTNHADVKASLGFTSVTHLDQFADKNKKSQYTFQVYSENGDCTELLDGRSSYSPVHIEGKGEIYVTDNPRRDTVYNFEVADNHTYYIFDKLWVHNDNCPVTTDADVKPYNKNVPVPKSHSEISKQFMRAVTEDGACFPAGTRITTDKGLKRIEDIQVGDMVLSKHESGIGEQEFKPVIRTVVHHNKEIWGLEYCIVRKSVKANSLSDFDILNMSRKGKVFGIYATPNHPFWVKGVGWTRLDALEQGQLLEMKDKEYSAYVIFANPIYQTNVPKIFAKLSFDTYLDVREYLDDINYTHSQDNPYYSFFKYAENIGDRESLNNGLMTKSPFTDSEYGEIIPSTDTLLSTVYNFEVADNHTYYISDKLWVHNVNCPDPTNADVKRRIDGGAIPLKDVKIFHSSTAANAYFRQNPNTTEIAIVKVGTARISKTTNRKVRIMHHFKPNFLEIEILNKLGIENPYKDDEY